MGKWFFLTSFTLVLSVFAFMFAYQAHMLPDPVHSFIFQIERSLPFFNSSVNPSLQKFEGVWKVSFIPVKAGTEIGTCAIEDGLVRARTGVFKGAVGVPGRTLTFSAITDDEGKVEGTFGSNSNVRKGTLSGSLGNGEGWGVWKDQYECNGTITFTKQDAVIDPVQGRVVSVDGDSVLVRGGRVRSLLPGMQLYVGDTIETRGGSVLLGMGVAFGTAVNVPPSTTYKVGQ